MRPHPEVDPVVVSKELHSVREIHVLFHVSHDDICWYLGTALGRGKKITRERC
jgi:hypothetical protein